MSHLKPWEGDWEKISAKFHVSKHVLKEESSVTGILKSLWGTKSNGTGDFLIKKIFLHIRFYSNRINVLKSLELVFDILKKIEKKNSF